MLDVKTFPFSTCTRIMISKGLVSKGQYSKFGPVKGFQYSFWKKLGSKKGHQYLGFVPAREYDL